MISPILPPPTAYSWRGGRSSPSPAWEDVERFDDQCIVLRTGAGVLVVSGESLHIGKLSLDGGELHVDGRIDALTYEDAPETRAAGCSAACSAEVGTVVSEQLRAYLTAAALGAAAGAVYDLLRLVRLRRRWNRRLTHGLDAAFLLLVAPAMLWYALRVGQGELRLIMLTAMGLGAAVYLLALSPLMRPLWDFWLSAAASTGRLLWWPVKKIYGGGEKKPLFFVGSAL